MESFPPVGIRKLDDKDVHIYWVRWRLNDLNDGLPTLWWCHHLLRCVPAARPGSAPQIRLWRIITERRSERPRFFFPPFIILKNIFCLNAFFWSLKRQSGPTRYDMNGFSFFFFLHYWPFKTLQMTPPPPPPELFRFVLQLEHFLTKGRKKRKNRTPWTDSVSCNIYTNKSVHFGSRSCPCFNPRTFLLSTKVQICNTHPFSFVLFMFLILQLFERSSF